MSLMTWVVKRRDVYKNDLLKHFLSTFYKDGLILFETNDINCDKQINLTNPRIKGFQIVISMGASLSKLKIERQAWPYNIPLEETFDLDNPSCSQPLVEILLMELFHLDLFLSFHLVLHDFLLSNLHQSFVPFLSLDHVFLLKSALLLTQHELMLLLILESLNILHGSSLSMLQASHLLLERFVFTTLSLSM